MNKNKAQFETTAPDQSWLDNLRRMANLLCRNLTSDQREEVISETAASFAVQGNFPVNGAVLNQAIRWRALDILKKSYTQKRSGSTLSLDHKYFEDKTPLSDLLVIDDKNPRLDLTEVGSQMTTCRLNESEKLMTVLYYYCGFTFDEIGQILGVTCSRISQRFKAINFKITKHTNIENLK